MGELTLYYSEKQCLGDLPDLPNAVLSVEVKREVGSRVNYMCNSGYYHASGENMAICMYDENWSSIDIQCERK